MKYEIVTNHWTGKEMEVWRAGEKCEMARAFFYLRHAYPDATTVLLCDGYLVSTAELAVLARWIIN